jgi:tyrosine-protein phosphatase non-receptor type 6
MRLSTAHSQKVLVDTPVAQPQIKGDEPLPPLPVTTPSTVVEPAKQYQSEDENDGELSVTSSSDDDDEAGLIGPGVDASKLESVAQVLRNVVKNRKSREIFESVERSPGNTDYRFAQTRANGPKNRYTNILPYNETRVKLDAVSDDPSSDYINANYVADLDDHTCFIATQGPLERTTADFWRMIWQENSRIILMVTTLEVNGTIKCFKYWPDVQEEREYGAYIVRCLEEDNFGDYVLRRLELRPIDESAPYRVVTQVQFVSWPDHGVPSSTDPALSCLKYVDKQQRDAERNDKAGPMVIHCSAGIGRTGTIIIADIARKIAMRTGSVPDMGDILEKIRMGRGMLVESIHQFEFAHILVSDALLDVADRIKAKN